MDSFYETTKLLRLLLLAQLVDKTGILWTITIDRCHWDIKLTCRYGYGKYEILETAVSLEKAAEYIEDMMNENSWEITKAYSRRQKTKYDWG